MRHCMEGDGRRREFEWLCVACMGSFNSTENHVDIWLPGILDAELWYYRSVGVGEN